MGLAVIKSRALVGINAPEVLIEAHLSNGLPQLSIVGLPETTVKESKDRVRSAIINSGFKFPNKRITINLAPADLPKTSGRFDLPIALGILFASGQISLNKKNIDDYEFAGELSLSGKIRAVGGIVPMAVLCEKENKILVVAIDNLPDVSLVENINALGGSSLKQVADYFSSNRELTKGYDKISQTNKVKEIYSADLSDVKGQYQARRALELAAAGGHNLLFVGPPGTGKTMLAIRLNTILPTLSKKEALTSAMIASTKNETDIAKNFFQRPFRAPHHTSSGVALVGGGSSPKPGEISLAHNGILFLDELPEFERRVLEVLREPLESGKISISRARVQVEYPAKFQLIAAMNPCPCGYLGSQYKECKDNQNAIQRYQNKVSGPLLDRIDLHVEVLELSKDDLTNQELKGESSADVRKRVEKTRYIQNKRQGKINASLTSVEVDKYCELGDKEKEMLQIAITKLGLSARSYYKIIKVARTIADLDKKETISTRHLQEALSYRKMDKFIR